MLGFGEDGAVASRSFGLVEGGVGGFEEFFGGVALVGVDGAAKACGDLAWLSGLGDVADVGDVLAGLFGELDGVLGVEAGEDEGELFSSVAGGEVVWADGFSERVGDEFEDVVSAVVPFFFVELSEVVDVDHDGSQALSSLVGEGDLTTEELLHGAVVGDSGEGVGGGEAFGGFEDLSVVEGE